jgi:hypothetical protein
VGVPEPLVPVDWQALAKTYVTTVFDAAAQVRRGVGWGCSVNCKI